MIVSKDYGAAWGLVAKKDGEVVDYVRLDLDTGRLVSLDDKGEEVDSAISDYEIDGLVRFNLMHGD